MVDPEHRPNATRLLKIQNDLEDKYYGECVSRISSNYNRTENGKYAIFGSPQSTYKVYNNNYLPPASVKNRKGHDIKKPKIITKENLADINQQSSTMVDSAETQIQKEQECGESTPTKAVNSSECAAVVEVCAIADEPTKSAAPVDDASAAIKLDETKAWHNYDLFSDSETFDYSWLDIKYRLEQVSVDEESSRRHSQSFSDDNEEDSRKFSDINNEGHPLDNQGALINDFANQSIDNPNLPQISKAGESLINSIGSAESINQYHLVESNGSMFVGEAIKHGVGVLFDKDPETNQSLTYKGEFKYDMRDGSGQQSYKDGTIYNGAWKCDKPHGHGVFLFTDGRTYEGQFEEGVSKGSGIIIKAISNTYSIMETPELNSISQSYVPNLSSTKTEDKVQKNISSQKISH